MTSSSRKRTTTRKRAPARRRTESREQAEQGFRDWLDYMNEAIEEFFERLPVEVRSKLDFSVDSLDVLEAWLLERYSSIEATRAETDSLVLDGAARYIGETFCKRLGGHWCIDVEHNTFLGLPQVTGFRSGPGALCPLSLATASTDRRFGDFISSILRNHLVDLPEHEPG